MPATPTYAFPYPALSDAPNGPAQIQALANQVETKLLITDGNVSTNSSDIVALQAATSKIGGEWRANASQALNTGANKLTFPTAVVAATGITFNGTDTWTVVTSGVYSIFSQVRASALVNAGVAVGTTSYSDGTLILPHAGFTGGFDYAISGNVYLTAGQQFCVYVYNNTSNTTTNFALRPAMAKIWRVAGA